MISAFQRFSFSAFSSGPSPPGGDGAGQNARRQRIDNLSDHEPGMEIYENSGVNHDRRRERHPTDGGEAERTDATAGEHAAHSRDEKEDRSDGDAGQERDGGGESVTAVVLCAPGVRRPLLKTMEHDSHPEPTGEDGKDSGDRAGGQG